MRIVFSGGGTGGHILPGIAVLQALREQNPHVEILWIGEKGGLEEKFSKKFHFPFRGIHAGKLRRYFSWKNVSDFFRIPIGFSEAFFALRKFRPDVVFVKGGYVSFPTGLAAALLRIPLVLHESDVIPGLATKLLTPFAKEVFFGFPSLSAPRKARVSGTPIRKEILHGVKEKGYKLTGFSSRSPILLVMGGSLGAANLNTLLWNALPELLSFCQIIHLTGQGKMSVLVEEKARYHALEYAEEELPHLYAIADLVVTRAGATVLSELLALHKPHIIVPLTLRASRGDQIANAKYFSETFQSKVLLEESLTKEKFISEIKDSLTPTFLDAAKNAISLEVSHLFRESASNLAKALLALQKV